MIGDCIIPMNRSRNDQNSDICIYTHTYIYIERERCRIAGASPPEKPSSACFTRLTREACSSGSCMGTIWTCTFQLPYKTVGVQHLKRVAVSSLTHRMQSSASLARLESGISSMVCGFFRAHTRFPGSTCETVKPPSKIFVYSVYSFKHARPVGGCTQLSQIDPWTKHSTIASVLWREFQLKNISGTKTIENWSQQLCDLYVKNPSYRTYLKLIVIVDWLL